MTDDTAATTDDAAVEVDASIIPRLTNAAAKLIVAGAAGWLLKSGFISKDEVAEYTPLAIGGVVLFWQYLNSKSTHDKLVSMQAKLPNSVARLTSWLK